MFNFLIFFIKLLWNVVIVKLVVKIVKLMKMVLSLLKSKESKGLTKTSWDSLKDYEQYAG